MQIEEISALPQPGRAAIAAALAAFEEAAGARLCIKLLEEQRFKYSELAASLGHHHLHDSAFCLGVKEKFNQRCRDCDLSHIPALAQREKRVFFHTCHAGATEVIVPLFVENSLVALAFVGQFRVREEQPASLPLYSEEQSRQLMRLVSLLEAYLQSLTREPAYGPGTTRAQRKESILRFLREQLAQAPDLSDLALHLGLSVTRTAHVVREVLGSSFAEVKDELRLKRASELLKNTHYKIPHIASACGFSTPQYFHRFFKLKTGLTPAQFRAAQQSEP